MKKILVVVDMQNDFITGPLGTPEAVSIVDNVVEKIRGEEWDYIFTTIDTHDKTYLETREGQKLPVEHCIAGTRGQCVNDEVWIAIYTHMHGENYRGVAKNTFGSVKLIDDLHVIYPYSVDNEQDDFELTLVGVCTDICVISNALLLKAHYPDMKIVVDASCCAGSTPKLHKEALHVMKSCHIDIINERLYRPAGWNEEAEKLFVDEKTKKKPYNEEECNKRYMSSCVIDRDCSEYCNMECPYEESED